MGGPHFRFQSLYFDPDSYYVVVWTLDSCRHLSLVSSGRNRTSEFRKHQFIHLFYFHGEEPHQKSYATSEYPLAKYLSMRLSTSLTAAYSCHVRVADAS